MIERTESGTDAAALFWRTVKEHLKDEAVVGFPVQGELERLRKAKRFCFGCLRIIDGTKPLTKAHIFNKAARGLHPKDVRFASNWWEQDGVLWTAIAAGITVEERPVKLVGTWEKTTRWGPVRHLKVPLCESCRQTERLSDTLARQRYIIRESQRNTIPLQGLPNGATIRAGSVITVEDQRHLAEEYVWQKALTFLRTLTLLLMHEEPLTLDELRRYRSMDPGRESIRWNPGPQRVTVTTPEGADQFPTRIVTVKDWIEHENKAREIEDDPGRMTGRKAPKSLWLTEPRRVEFDRIGTTAAAELEGHRLSRVQITVNRDVVRIERETRNGRHFMTSGPADALRSFCEKARLSKMFEERGISGRQLKEEMDIYRASHHSGVILEINDDTPMGEATPPKG